MTEELLIAGALSEILGAPGDAAYDRRLRLREDLGLDSVALVDLMVEVEHRCGIAFDPLDTDFGCVFATVGSLMRFVRRRRNPKPPARKGRDAAGA